MLSGHNADGVVGHEKGATMTVSAQPAAIDQQVRYGSKPAEYFGKPRRDYVDALAPSNTAATLEIAPLMRPGARVFASSPCLAHWSNQPDANA